jgi:DNA-directed RNA polymerase specialized sigma24 family protein
MSPRIFKKAPRGVITVASREREAFRMRYELGWSRSKIAEHFGVSGNAVSAWCKRVSESDRDARLARIA